MLMSALTKQLKSRERTESFRTTSSRVKKSRSAHAIIVDLESKSWAMSLLSAGMLVSLRCLAASMRVWKLLVMEWLVYGF